MEYLHNNNNNMMITVIEKNGNHYIIDIGKDFKSVDLLSEDNLKLYYRNFVYVGTFNKEEIEKIKEKINGIYFNVEPINIKDWNLFLEERKSIFEFLTNDLNKLEIVGFEEIECESEWDEWDRIVLRLKGTDVYCTLDCFTEDENPCTKYNVYKDNRNVGISVSDELDIVTIIKDYVYFNVIYVLKSIYDNMVLTK